MSGTNAHIILEQAPPLVSTPNRPPNAALVPWVVSAKSEAALDNQLARAAADDRSQVDIGFSLHTHVARPCSSHRDVCRG